MVILGSANVNSVKTNIRDQGRFLCSQMRIKRLPWESLGPGVQFLPQPRASRDLGWVGYPAGTPRTATACVLLSSASQAVAELPVHKEPSVWVRRRVPTQRGLSPHPSIPQRRETNVCDKRGDREASCLGTVRAGEGDMVAGPRAGSAAHSQLFVELWSKTGSRPANSRNHPPTPTPPRPKNQKGNDEPLPHVAPPKLQTSLQEPKRPF